MVPRSVFARSCGGMERGPACPRWSTGVARSSGLHHVVTAGPLDAAGRSRRCAARGTTPSAFPSAGVRGRGSLRVSGRGVGAGAERSDGSARPFLTAPMQQHRVARSRGRPGCPRPSARGPTSLAISMRAETERRHPRPGPARCSNQSSPEWCATLVRSFPSAARAARRVRSARSEPRSGNHLRGPSGRSPPWFHRASRAGSPRCISKPSPGSSTGCLPTTPSPCTSRTWPVASVITQCRASSCTGPVPSFSIWIVYRKNHSFASGSECSAEYRASTRIRTPSVHASEFARAPIAGIVADPPPARTRP